MVYWIGKHVHIAAFDKAGGRVNRFWGFPAAAFLPAWASAAAVLVFLSACDSPVATVGADGSPPPAKSPAAEAGSAASKPLITRNSDGTITIQKVPPNGDTEGKNGLVIPPQILTPEVRIPETKQ
jgi:hypothetical protein